MRETVEHRSSFPESWFSRAFLFRMRNRHGLQPVQCCEEFESWERGFESPQPHHRMSRFAGRFSLQSGFQCATGTARDDRFHQTLLRTAALKAIWDQMMRTLKLLTDTFRFCVPPKEMPTNQSVGFACSKRHASQRSEKSSWCVRKLGMLVIANIMGITRARVPKFLSQPVGLLTSNVTLILSNSGFPTGRFFKILNSYAQIWVHNFGIGPCDQRNLNST